MTLRECLESYVQLAIQEINGGIEFEERLISFIICCAAICHYFGTMERIKIPNISAFW